MMNYDSIVLEFREQFQIPNYVSDDVLSKYAEESGAYFFLLRNDLDLENDLTVRELIKSRMFYAYNHQVGAFNTDYNADIVSWQMSKDKVVE